MAKQISSLSVALFATVAPFATGLKHAEKSVHSFVGAVTGAGSTLLKLSGLTTAVAAGFEAVTAVGRGFALASQLEQAQVAFETMLGSAATAKKVLGDLSDFAAATPFKLPELISASKQLIAFGITSTELMPDLKQIGDIASGIGAPIGEIASIFGKVSVAGKLTGETLKQLQEHGVPISAALAKQFKVPQAAVGKLVEESKVGFGDIKAAFGSLTGPGGQFAGMMDKQSKTVGGLMSTLSDSVDMTLAKLAMSFIDTFNVRDGIRAATKAMDTLGGVVISGMAKVAPIIKSVAISTYNAFAGLYTRAAPYLAILGRGVAFAFTGIVNVVTTYGGAIYTAVSKAFTNVYNYVAPIMASIWQVVANNWQSVLATTVAYGLGIYNAVTAYYGMLVDVASGIWDLISQAWVAGSNFIMDTTNTTGASVAQVFQGILTAVQTVQQGYTAAFNVIAYAMSHWRDVSELVLVSVALDVVRMGNQLEYVFMTVLPYAANYAGHAFADFAANTLRYFENIGSNVGRFFTNLPGLIKGTTHFSDIWKPLGDGMMDTLKLLPAMAERETGPLEAALTTQVNDLTNKLGDGLGNYMGKTAVQAKDAAKVVTNAIQNTIKAASNVPGIKKPTIPQPDPLKITPVVNPANLTVGITPELHRAKAIRAGSAEALSLRYGVGGKPHAQLASVPKPATLPVKVPASGVASAYVGSGTGGDAFDAWKKAQAGKSTANTFADWKAHQTGGPQLSQIDAWKAEQAAQPKVATAFDKWAANKDRTGKPLSGGPLLDEDKRQTYWLQRLEQNTRNIAPTVVTIG